METTSSKKLGENFNGDRGGAQGTDLGGRDSVHGAGFCVNDARNLGSAVEEQRGAHGVGIVGGALIKQGEKRSFDEESIGDATKGPIGGSAMAGEGTVGSAQCKRENAMTEGPMDNTKGLGGTLLGADSLGFAPGGNGGEISAGPMTGGASVSMLQDVKLAKERLWGFVTHTEVEEVASRGPEGVVDAVVKGFALIREALDGQAAERQARKAAEEQLGLERQAREDVVEQLELERQAREDAAEHLRLAHESDVILETELQVSYGRAAKLEADLQVALERTTRAEAYSTKMKKERDAAERAKAGAFIDGYEELKRKVSAAFPTYDFSGFLPYEAPETDDEEASYDGSKGNE